MFTTPKTLEASSGTPKWRIDQSACAKTSASVRCMQDIRLLWRPSTMTRDHFERDKKLPSRTYAVRARRVRGQSADSGGPQDGHRAVAYHVFTPFSVRKHHNSFAYFMKSKALRKQARVCLKAG